MAGLCRYLWSKYTGETRVTLAWSQYLSRVAVVAVVSGLDIGLSQWSLEYVTLSLYTMTKTTSTPFILFFGLLLKLEKKVIFWYKKKVFTLAIFRWFFTLYFLLILLSLGQFYFIFSILVHFVIGRFSTISFDMVDFVDFIEFWSILGHFLDFGLFCRF